MLTKQQIVSNLRVARKNLQEKLQELAEASCKVSTITTQLIAAREEYDQLDNSGRSDPATVKRLRDISDLLDRYEHVNVDSDGDSAKLIADIRILNGVAGELYFQKISPLVDKLENQLIEQLRPFFRAGRAEFIAANCDCLAYLR